MIFFVSLGAIYRSISNLLCLKGQLIFFLIFWTYFRPVYPTEELEEEEITEDDAELTLNKLEEDVVVGLPVWFSLYKYWPTMRKSLLAVHFVWP